MEPDFWHERWDLGQTAFDQAVPHRSLDEHWASHVEPGGDVFVPLCGRSVDMEWLANHGHRVVGIELSSIAITEFFESRGISPRMRSEGDSTVYSGGAYELWCGDFFAMAPGTLSNAVAAYDRASLVALPPEMRRRYAAHLRTILPERATIFLVTFEYDQSAMSGPPFSVPQDEVAELYGDDHDIEVVASDDVSERNPDLGARGATRLAETLTVLRRRPPG